MMKTLIPTNPIQFDLLSLFSSSSILNPTHRLSDPVILTWNRLWPD